MEQPVPDWLKAHQRLLAAKSAPSPGESVNSDNREADPRLDLKRKVGTERVAESKARGGTPDTPSLDPTVDERLAEPTVAKKLLYEEFARSFMIDFNQTRAAVRMGYQQSTAKVYGNQFFWQPYTQAYLVQLIRSIEEHTIVSRNEVLAGLLREANRFDIDASSGTRIMAWKEIGKILGMYVQRIEISANSSGVMEVPMVTSVDQWEQLAGMSQQKLLDTVRA